jgi:hypothetical protein
MTPHRSDAPARPTASRRAWVSPVVTDLPRLTQLTLTTGTPIPGGSGSGGSTVIP